MKEQRPEITFVTRMEGSGAELNQLNRKIDSLAGHASRVKRSLNKAIRASERWQKSQ
jgi:hypothetical protein